MQVNLGLTAEAAAAHRHEFSPSTAKPCCHPETCANSHNSISQGLMSLMKRSVLPFSIPTITKLTAQNLQHPAISSEPAPIPRGSIDEELGSPVDSEPELIIDSKGDNDNVNLDNASSSIKPKKKQLHRSKISFRFAHPPPTTLHKRLRIRPRLLLQVQQVSQTSRLVSALDVLPTTLFGPLSARKLQRERQCPNDLIIVPSDTSEVPWTDDEDESSNDPRDIIAKICNLRKDEEKSKGAAEICLKSGARWVVNPLSNGGYEFSTTDSHGVNKCVRWVMRSKGSSRLAGSISGADSMGEDDRRFIFSIIDPNTRRHPVIGWMSRNGIETLDQNDIRNLYDQRHPERTESFGFDASNAEMERKATVLSQKPPQIEIDDSLSTLIVITGIWVAFREGWAQSPPISESQPSPNSTRNRGESKSELEGMMAYDPKTRRSTDDVNLQDGQQGVDLSTRRGLLRRSMPPPTDEHQAETEGGKAFSDDESSVQASKRARWNRPRNIFCVTGGKDRSLPPNRSISMRSSHGRINTPPNAELHSNPGFGLDMSSPDESDVPDLIRDTDNNRNLSLPLSSKSMPARVKKWRRLGNWLDTVVKKPPG